MTELLYTPQAHKDLHDIRSYINEELLNPSASVNVLTRITKKIRSLAKYPLMGSALSSIADVVTDYRYLVCGNYTAFYRYDSNAVYIIRILYGRRDFMKILFGAVLDDNDDQ